MVRIYGVTTTSSNGGTGGTGTSITAPSVTLYGTTSGFTSTFLTTNGSATENADNIILVDSNTTIFFKAIITAINEVGTRYSASWELSGLLERETSVGSTKLIGVGMTSCVADAQLRNLKISLSENTSYGGLSINCTGLSSYTLITWNATVTYQEG
jgi:hypothetical protein